MGLLLIVKEIIVRYCRKISLYLEGFTTDIIIMASEITYFWNKRFKKLLKSTSSCH